MKKIGTAGQIEQIEKLIKADTDYYPLQDGTHGIKGLFQDEPDKSRSFVKSYDVYDLKENNNPWLTWLFAKGVVIKLYFDYRNDKGSVEIKDKEVYRATCLMPELSRVLLKMKSCQPVMYTNRDGKTVRRLRELGNVE